MSDSQISETSSIIPQSSQSSIRLDELKSLFYQLNAKPDTEIRLLPGGKTLELADIRRINEEVSAKLRNHDLTAQIASINFILSNQKIKDYSTWAEFERANWDNINEKIESLNINWDILIKLPQYEFPQRHSMKLRVGNALPPKDIIHLLLTSDDVSELMELGSPSVCKVDFINNIIAIELLNIVSNWYDGVRNSPEPSPVQKFLKKHGKSLSEIIRYASPILFLFIFYLYSNYLFYFIGIEKDVSVDTFQKITISMISVFMVGLFIGYKTERYIDKKVDKLEEYPRFAITRGDKKSIEEFEQRNGKLTRQILSRFFWTLFTTLVSYPLKIIISYFIPLNNSR